MTEPIALSTTATLALIAAIGLGLAFAGGLIVFAMRRRGDAKPDIPPGMRPGPADEVLERRHVERTMAWGFVFMAVIALSVAWVWVREPDQNVADAIELTHRAEERGERWFGIADESNPTGFGCARCHGVEAEGGSIPFLNPDTGDFNPAYPVPPLNNVCGRLTVADPDESPMNIRDTIMQGRPGTPMPSWSVRFAGPMNDQQVQDLIAYLITIQTVPDDQNLCTNPAAAAETEAEEPGTSPSPDVTPGVPGEEEPSEETESPESEASPETEDA
jgi:mono/diheme cytochrome c family protein